LPADKILQSQPVRFRERGTETLAQALSVAKRPLPAEWLCVFEPAIRFGAKGYLSSDADPFTLYGIDSDPIPIEDREGKPVEIPNEAVGVFSPLPLDGDFHYLVGLGGTRTNQVADIPPRLDALARWLARVCREPHAMWWAAGTNGLHPAVLRNIAEVHAERMKDEADWIVVGAITMQWLRKHVLLLVLIAAALAGEVVAANADTRIALVIGNARYQSTAALANPANDATDVAAALGRLGFDARLVLDASRREMDRAIGQFARDAKGADSALIYFAGHGMQFEGRNYVVPVDAELQDDISVRYELTAVDDLKDALENSRGVKILVLDSCRDNPLATKLARSLSATHRDLAEARGLAPFKQPNGIVVAYATQADQTAEDGSGRNSPFSAAFLKELQTPRLEVAALFRKIQQDVYRSTNGEQRPELSISLVPDYYLNQEDTDQTVWARIREKPDSTALREFLARFPDSFYAPDAAARLELIARPQQPANETVGSKRAPGSPTGPEATSSASPSTPPAIATVTTQSAPSVESGSKVSEPAPPAVATAAAEPLPVASTKVIACPTNEVLDSGRCIDACPAEKVLVDGKCMVACSSYNLADFADGCAGSWFEPSTEIIACPVNETLDSGRCIAKTCPIGQVLSRSGACIVHPSRTAAAPRPTAVNGPKAPANRR
jgi:Caspase domain